MPALKVKLRQLREAQDLSQRDLAKRAGISVGYVAELETGRLSNPSLKVLVALAKALRVEVEDFIR
jgi:transcriptional regulator with XRE-family HTH domain